MATPSVAVALTAFVLTAIAFTSPRKVAPVERPDVQTFEPVVVDARFAPLRPKLLARDVARGLLQPIALTEK